MNQRTIKFRALWKAANMVVPVDWIELDGAIKFRIPVTATIDGKTYAYDEHEQLDEPDEYVLMQFTGLHDKNGKEIWEGDVVRHKWFHGGALQVIEDLPHLYHEWIEYGVYEPNKEGSHWEVIGNIYENPELLQL